jgi:4-hydroxybenzoate polyprenyltransferase
VGHPLGRLALLHPFPSVLDGALVASLYVVAGGAVGPALLLGLGMLGFQVSIGALNDLTDATADAAVKRWKPIPAGRVTTQVAGIVVGAGAILGVVSSAWFGVVVVLIGLAGYACGVAYDMRLKRAGLGWLAFALAVPLLLLFPWVAATGQLPPRWMALLPIAAAAGPMLHLANTLVDREADEATAVPSAAVRLGRRRAWLLLVALTVGVYGCAWASLLLGEAPPAAAVTLSVVATMTAGTGLVLSAGSRPPVGAWGWSLQAVAAALLGLGWLAAASA